MAKSKKPVKAAKGKKGVNPFFAKMAAKKGKKSAKKGKY